MKYRTPLILFVFSLLAIMYTGCRKPFGISGNGNVITETRKVFSFNEIDSKATFNVYIEQDSIYQVVVQAESNLIPYVQTNVNGNTLIITTNENMQEHYPINVYVKTPTLNYIELSGSGIVQSDTISTNNLSVKLSGSGNMNGAVRAPLSNIILTGSGNINYYQDSENLSSTISGSGAINLIGTATTASHLISGSGNLNAFSLLSDNVQATISGSGNMYVNAEKQLNVSISGSGSLYYLGNPSTNVNISGSGSVIKQ
jgi:hypothetical protein